MVRHVEFCRKRGHKTEVAPGFKNSKTNGGTKEMPVFPETFDGLKAVYVIGKKGLVFHDEEGAVFTYSTIRNAYDRAFKRASLPYSGTHVMRHGGTREVLNSTGGDFTIAGQLLGNSDMGTIQTYAKREKTALTKVAHRQWQERDNKGMVTAIGRKEVVENVGS